MALIAGIVLVLGGIGTITLLRWDTFLKCMTILEAEMQHSRWARSSRPKTQRIGFLKIG